MALDLSKVKEREPHWQRIRPRKLPRLSTLAPRGDAQQMNHLSAKIESRCLGIASMVSYRRECI